MDARRLRRRFVHIRDSYLPHLHFTRWIYMNINEHPHFCTPSPSLLLQNLVAPKLRRDNTFEQLVAALKQHFEPKPTTITPTKFEENSSRNEVYVTSAEDKVPASVKNEESLPLYTVGVVTTPPIQEPLTVIVSRWSWIQGQ